MPHRPGAIDTRVAKYLVGGCLGRGWGVCPCAHVCMGGRARSVCVGAGAWRCVYMCEGGRCSCWGCGVPEGARRGARLACAGRECLLASSRPRALVLLRQAPQLPPCPSQAAPALPLPRPPAPAAAYGDRAGEVTRIAEQRRLGKRIVRGYPILEAEVVYAGEGPVCG